MGHIEVLSAVVRVPGDYGEYCSWGAALRHLAPGQVEVLVAVRMPTVEEMHDLRKTMISNGITKAFVRRLQPDGTFEERIIEARNVSGELV